MRLSLLPALLGLTLAGLTSVRGQAPGAPLPTASLDQLLAPIALYPDPLISLILPASTFPGDLQAAAAYLGTGGDPNQVDAQPWDASVKGLVHYPQVVTWMVQNLDWTQSLGAAFAAQPADVMASVQRLRGTALAAGTLTNTPQQQVVTQDSEIEIQPAQPDVIYVPQYDPAVVFVDQPYYGYGGPYLSYGPGYPVGPWLTYGAFWGGGVILTADWGFWHGPGGWWRPAYPPRSEWAAYRGGYAGGVRGGMSVDARFGSFHAWSYPADRPRPQFSARFEAGRSVPGPRPMAGVRRAPQPPRSAYRNPQTGATVHPAFDGHGAPGRAATSRAAPGGERAPAENRGNSIPHPAAPPPAPRAYGESRGAPAEYRGQAEAVRPAGGNGAVREYPQRPAEGRPAGAPRPAPRPAPKPAPKPSRPEPEEHEREH